MICYLKLTSVDCFQRQTKKIFIFKQNHSTIDLKTDYMDNYNLKDLRELSRSRGLKVSGSKSELISRLKNHKTRRGISKDKRDRKSVPGRSLVPKVNISSTFKISASLPFSIGNQNFPQMNLLSLPITMIKTMVDSYRSSVLSSSAISYSSGKNIFESKIRSTAMIEYQQSNYITSNNGLMSLISTPINMINMLYRSMITFVCWYQN